MFVKKCEITKRYYWYYHITQKELCIIKIWLGKCEFQDASLINCASGIDSHGCLFKKHAPEY